MYYSFRFDILRENRSVCPCFLFFFFWPSESVHHRRQMSNNEV